MKIVFLWSWLAIGWGAFLSAGEIPVPSARQLQWHQLEQYAFIHFGLNTYTDKEWGFGDEDPQLFNPTEFNAAAIVAAIKNGGFKGIILTAKHHDGFCLWQTATTEHHIGKAKFREGNGDLVKEIADAARAAGLKFGVYVSPWDRNNAHYGNDEYVKIYHQQIKELLTNYGELFEVWFDGANGGDGFYGGARATRKIDNKTYYQWDKVHAMIRELQPNAVIFGDGGPDVRWVGNESGYAKDPCRATINAQGWSPGNYVAKYLGSGQKDGTQWIPAECDVSIRPGWFWHASENEQVKTAAQLFDLYCQSVGRGAAFLLNIPPDTRGKIHENDAAVLAALGKKLSATFAHDLARTAQKNISENGEQITLTFDAPITFDLIRLRENIVNGARVENWQIEYQTAADEAWKTLSNGVVIGACRIVRAEAPLTAKTLRVTFTNAIAKPEIAEFGVYKINN